MVHRVTSAIIKDIHIGSWEREEVGTEAVKDVGNEMVETAGIHITPEEYPRPYAACWDGGGASTTISTSMEEGRLPSIAGGGPEYGGKEGVVEPWKSTGEGPATVGRGLSTTTQVQKKEKGKDAVILTCLAVRPGIQGRPSRLSDVSEEMRGIQTDNGTASHLAGDEIQKREEDDKRERTEDRRRKGEGARTKEEQDYSFIKVEENKWNTQRNKEGTLMQLATTYLKILSSLSIGGGMW
ncbi:hypothetical protein PPACK8108_LOCUS2265 [Phakopsora pachyrhizi]|uniref:Uncharacterized protein n=1 Tax=Phakopsora pachyrhizi TaxID=170000 RepID=A0AAV0AJS2_PHAPC|nr:hypothetical protein PPACK8108_LOCUS2265 [Phakopsora pachyrhizi]